MSNEPTNTNATDVTDAITSIEDVVVLSANAVKSAIEDYGTDAVDLALMIYRIEAIQHIAVGITGLVILAFCMYFAFNITPKKIHPWVQADESYGSERSMIYMGIACVSAILIPTTVLMTSNLFSIIHWFAAFGYPEVLVAYKALVAAGVM